MTFVSVTERNVRLSELSMQQTTTPHPLDDEAGSIESRGPLPIQQRATVEIVMTENPNIPPAKKIIQDPPEYATAPNVAKSPGGNVQLEDPAEIPSDGAEAPASKDPKESGDWLGGPQNGEEENHLGDWLGGPQNGAEAPGEGARNPQTGERIARNPRTGS